MSEPGPKAMRVAVRLGAVIASALGAAPAIAGSPYTTDDPEPCPTGHWESRAFVNGLQTPGETAGQSGLDINYGMAKDLQLSVLAPLDYTIGDRNQLGNGNLLLAAKYRFIHQSSHGVAPDVAIFPAVTLPTQAKGFGPARMALFLPVWAQKDFGPWSVFGGAGYTFNHGPGKRDFTLSALAVTRQLGKRLNLGVEIYHQTPDAVGGEALTAVAGGVVYQLSRHFALMGSAGPAVQGASRAGQAVFYAAIQFTD